MQSGPLASLLLLMSFASAQESHQPPPASASKTPTVSSTRPTRPKRDPSEQHALKLLQAVESSVGRFSPEAQAKLLLQIGKAYEKIDRPRAVAALETAFQATFGMRSSSNDPERSNLQSRIVSSLSRLQPEAVFALRNSADPEARALIEQQIVTSAVAKGQIHQAAQMLSQWDTNLSFPYGEAAQVIRQLPDKDTGERQAVFRTAILCFERVEDRIIPDEIMDFVIDLADAKLPPSMVVDGMERVLAHAKDMEFDDQHVSISGPKGSANFTSLYDYLLFQFLPVFDRLDSAKGEALRRDHAAVAEANSRYTKGVGSLQADETAGSKSGLTTSFSLGGTQVIEDTTGIQQIAAIESQSSTDFKGAMALAAGLSNAPTERSARVLNGRPRCDAYRAIAERMVSRSEFSHATEAIATMLSTAADLQPFGRVQYVISAIELNGKMKDWASVRQYIEKGMKLGSELYQDDAFGQCPNEASKLDWPSTAAWRSSLVPAALLDVGKAIQQAQAIPDPEIEASVQVAVASVLLDRRPSFNVAVIRCKESGLYTQFTVPWWENRQPAPAAAQSKP